jgi:hypothetical protein
MRRKSLTAALLLGIVCWVSEIGDAQTNGERASQKTEVVLLGTGMPYPDPKAAGPATAAWSASAFSSSMPASV